LASPPQAAASASTAAPAAAAPVATTSSAAPADLLPLVRARALAPVIPPPAALTTPPCFGVRRLTAPRAALAPLLTWGSVLRAFGVRPRHFEEGDPTGTAADAAGRELIADAQALLAGRLGPRAFTCSLTVHVTGPQREVKSP